MKYIVYIFLFLIYGFSLTAQEGIFKEDLCIHLDYGRFRYDEKNTFLEIYYAVINVADKAEQQKENCRILFTLENTENDSLLASQVLDLVLDNVQTTSEDYGTSKLGLIKTVLPEGKYQIALFHLDPETNKKLDYGCAKHCRRR